MSTELLRKYSMILKSSILVEAIDYTGMFNKVINSIDDEKRKENFIFTIKNNIIWARKTLKKNDRIVWYLRWLRIVLIKQEFYKSPSTIGNSMKVLIKKLTNNSDEFEIFSESNMNVADLRTRLEHFMSLNNVPAIQNYVWNKNINVDELLSKFFIYEQEWQDERKQSVEIQEGDKEIIKMGNQSWWLLDRTICKDEGDAMGHCGNAGTPNDGDRIISFRTHINGNLWKPHLTFILNSDGYIGESKGRNNNKPNKKYHPAIIKLLKNDMIKGITGGGYLPEHNFEMTDLSEETQKELYELKPGVAPLDIMYKMSNPDDYSNLIVRIKSILDNIPVDYIDYNASSKLFYITNWKNLGNCVNDIGNEMANNVWSQFQGEDIYDYHSYEISDSEIKDLFDAFPPKINNDLIKILKNNYPEQFEENNHNIYDTVMEFSSEIIRITKSAINQGLNSGANTAMYEEFKSAVNDTENGTIIINDNFWYGEVFFAYNLKELVYILSDEETLSEIQESEDIIDIQGNGQVINLEEPRYGWEGYDQEVAFEYFYDNLLHELI